MSLHVAIDDEPFLQKRRIGYFYDVQIAAQKHDVEVIYLTHLLPDRI